MIRPLIIISALMIMTGCEEAPSRSPNDAGDVAASSNGDSVVADPITECVRRGVSYYKEIGSYPTLQSAPNAGKAAEDVALERCQRTTTAF